jgi:hypothetical protein
MIPIGTRVRFLDDRSVEAEGTINGAYVTCHLQQPMYLIRCVMLYHVSLDRIKVIFSPPPRADGKAL